MPFANKLSRKFLFVWGGTVVATLVLVGVIFSILLIRQHHFTAGRTLQTSFQLIKNRFLSLDTQIDDLILSYARDRDVVSTVNLLNTYQDPQNYQALLFDGEKERLARQLVGTEHLLNHLIVTVFSEKGDLLSFSYSNPGKVRTSGYKTYKNGKDQFHLISENGEKRVVDSLPAIFSEALLFTSTKNGFSHGYRVSPLGLVHIDRVPITRDVKKPTAIGSIVSVIVFDVSFHEQISRLIGHQFDVQLTTNDAKQSPLPRFPADASLPSLFDDMAPFNVLSNEDFFIGAMKIQSMTSETANLVVGVDKQGFASGIETLQTTVLSVLALITIIVLPLGIFFIRRNLTHPIHQLMSGVEDLGTGNLSTVIDLKSGDEFGALASAFNKMAQTIKVREQDIKSGRDQLRLIADNLPILIVLVDADLRYQFANKTCVDWYKTSLENLVGRSAKDILGDGYEKIRPHINTAMRGERSTYEQTISYPDGVERTVRGLIVPRFGEENKVIGYIATAEDVTNLTKAEEQLRHAQKMDAVGQLTGGVAHDFNNMLSVVLGNLELILIDDDIDAETKKRLTSAFKAAQRSADLTRKLLDFSRLSAKRTKLVSANESIINLRELVSKSLTVAITIENRLDDNLWLIDVDPSELEDSLLNLSINARDAMVNGGILTFETANVEVNSEDVDQFPQLAPGKYVMITVSDQGEGIPTEVMKRIFEPFFSTKSVGKGTGLGLSMVYGFVHRSGGHITVDSEPDIGTTFRLYLPKAENETSAKDHSQKNSIQALPHGTETILAVDDEEDLLEITTDRLKALGYRVLSAQNGEEALSILINTPDIDLLFSDIIMPGKLDGYQLAKAAADLRPGLKILLASGFSNMGAAVFDEEHELLSALTRDLLNKPYNYTDLALSVRRTLDQ